MLVESVHILLELDTGIWCEVSFLGICGRSSGIMMGEEEVSVAAVNSGDNQNKNCLRFKLTRCGPQWIPEVTAKEPCTKKLAKRNLKIVKELENSFGRKELPEEVPYVEKCYEVSNSNISLEENSSCLQTTMTKFKLKRSGDKWFAEVTARAPCAKKQAKEVLSPNSSPKENASCLQPRPYISRSVQTEKRNNLGFTKKRSNNLHRLLFLPNGLQDGTKLAYCVNGKDILKGYKQGNGIVCSDCDTEISPSEFEAHAKYSARRKPYNYIRTTKGHSLHNIALRLSKGESIQSIMRSSDDN